MENQTIRQDWKLEELVDLFHSPLLELVWKAQQVLRLHHKPCEIQVCTVISVKTGGCPENCKYCGQSAHYQTGVAPQPLMSLQEVKEKARHAITKGVTRVCLSVAWREVRNGKVFDQILEMIQEVRALGIEVCCTLGMLNQEQADRLASAGLYSYNHNLDTSESFYSTIITTHTFQDRLKTLQHVHQATLGICCGGIVGMGESIEDRLELLRTLANHHPQPHSVPINQLVRIKGTPLAHLPPVPFWEFLRLIAIARILMPRAMVRLSGGRLHLSMEQHALCFMAGANSIHTGEKLLVTPSPSFDDDASMFKQLGLTYLPPFTAVLWREES